MSKASLSATAEFTPFNALLGESDSGDGGRGTSTASAGGALGIPTVIAEESDRAKALQVVDSEGEITFFNRSNHRLVFDADAENMQRWLLLRQAQQVLAHGSDAFVLRKKTDSAPWSPYHGQDFIGPVKPVNSRADRLHFAQDGTLQVVEHLQPKFRTVLCLNRHVPGRDASVWQAKESRNCSWHDLTVCGSPWTCPICAQRISLGRQAQITAVYNAVSSHTVGGCAYMLTFTVRHGIGDDCKVLVQQMKDAMRLLQMTQTFKAVTRRLPLKRPQAGSIPFLDYIGRIAALEATHGKNGWHPHEHHLWFFKRQLTTANIAQIKKQLFDAWRECCIAVGLPPPLRDFGLDIRRAFSAAEYLTKFAQLGLERRWGPEKEIASSHSKKAGGKGRSVMQILSDSMALDGLQSQQNDFAMNADAFLFLDFANAFLGKHQIQMSRTLKKWLLDCGIDIDTELGDADLAAALESESELQFEVDADDFRCIVRNKAQGAVLLTCKTQGSAAALAFIKSLPGRISTIDPAAGWMNQEFQPKTPFVVAPSFPLLDTHHHDDFLKGRDLDYWLHMVHDAPK